MASARLEIARRNVAKGEARVARQKEALADFIACGQPAQQAHNVLVVMENTLRMMIDHRDRLARDLARTKDGPPRREDLASVR